jgi:hypothetical protein
VTANRALAPTASVPVTNACLPRAARIIECVSFGAWITDSATDAMDIQVDRATTIGDHQVNPRRAAS